MREINQPSSRRNLVSNVRVARDLQAIYPESELVIAPKCRKPVNTFGELGKKYAMYRNERPPLANWILDVYRQLKRRICSSDSGLAKEKATTFIVTEELREADAEYSLQRLLDRGYLYLVDNELYVTDPDIDGAKE